MRPFQASEASSFHGRDEEISRLLGLLRHGAREIYVIGPSGSGKSSLIAAGLVPRLASSPTLAGATYVVRHMRPGGAPAGALTDLLEVTEAERGEAATSWLAEAVSRLLAKQPDIASRARGLSGRLMIFIDQLEELFSTAPLHEHTRFLEIFTALRDDRRVALVLALRADFYGSLMESSLWTALKGRLSRVDVSPLRGAKLQRAIEAPARAAGVYFEPVLIERLLQEVAEEPGALPLLQDTLLSLWHGRTRELLRLADYNAMGDGKQSGLAKMVSLRADHALRELPIERQRLAQRVFLRLVQFVDGITITRRQQPRDALASTGDAPSEIDLVVQHLADHRLITTSGEGLTPTEAGANVDLAHEVLLTAWPTLVEWIAARREDEQYRRTLEAKAAEWIRSGQGQSRLLDADELREVRNWLAGEQVRDLGLSQNSSALIHCSETRLQAQAEAEAVQARELRAHHKEVCRLLACTYVPRQKALSGDEGSIPASSSYLLSLDGRCVGVATASRDKVPVGKMWDEMTKMAFEIPPAQDVEEIRSPEKPAFEYEQPLAALMWSPDGLHIVTASRGRIAQVWEMADESENPPSWQRDSVVALTWSPDGQRVATASRDGTARVWDATTGVAITPSMAHHDSVDAMAWSPDGQYLVPFHSGSDGFTRLL